MRPGVGGMCVSVQRGEGGSTMRTPSASKPCPPLPVQGLPRSSFPPSPLPWSLVSGTTPHTPSTQVHARNKAVDPNINWYEVARAMAGFTGADCMGLMQRAARMAARQVSALRARGLHLRHTHL